MKKISYGKDNDINLKLMITLIRCFQSVRRAEDLWIKERGLTLSQFLVLELLYHKGSCTVGEVIEKTQSTAGNMTVVIENLKKEDYITKEKDPKDKRHYILTLTEKGRVLMADFFPFHMANLDKRFEIMSEKEKLEMIELLKKLGKYSPFDL